MQFSVCHLVLLLSIAAASPVPKAPTKAVTRATGSVLTSSTYNAIQISSGTAGNAQSEANALFAKIDMSNLAGVSASDLAIIKGTHDAAENAEVDAFNPAIAAASGAAATALQVSVLIQIKRILVLICWHRMAK